MRIRNWLAFGFLLVPIQSWAADTALHKVSKGTYGRILRGVSAQDFTKLSQDAGREVVMLMDHDGLNALYQNGDLSKQALIQRLDLIGYPKEYATELLVKGTKFKLLLMKAGVLRIQSATWDHLHSYLSDVYGPGSIVVKLSRQYIPELKKKTYDELAKQHGALPVEMTSKQLKDDSSLWDFRAFLSHELRLNRLFAGDGYTRKNDGTRGFAEYFVLNKKIKKSVIGDFELIDLN